MRAFFLVFGLVAILGGVSAVLNPRSALVYTGGHWKQDRAAGVPPKYEWTSPVFVRVIGGVSVAIGAGVLGFGLFSPLFRRNRSPGGS